MTILAKDIIGALKEKLTDFKAAAEAEKIGRVIKVGDGVATVKGLPDAAMSEILEFEGEKESISGLTLNLEEDQIGAVLFGDSFKIKEGDIVKRTGRILSVPVGEAFLGRITDPLGNPKDGRGPIESKAIYPIEKIAPSVIAREPVNTPIETGIKAIDSMIPIGRGQRELIIGDRQTGKTTIAIDTIINQNRDKSQKPVFCIYVAIGQKEGRTARIAQTLKKFNALDHTIIISTSAADPAPLVYLAPYAGCALGEYFMDQGKDALVIYDDLTKHAWAYRQMSLLLRRPAGREAYPGDIFYLHSRLLERSAKMSQKRGGGSLTALPIIETQLGDISSYIPTNVISITDGQIYLETDLFNQGVRPAINIGLSVSRVGSAAQTKIMKKVAGRLRLDLAQYQELAAFMQFSQELDKNTQGKLERGKRLIEILKQEENSPIGFEKQSVILFAGIRGYLDDVVIEKIRKFEKEFLIFCENQYPAIFREIFKSRELSKEIEEKIIEAIQEFKKIFV